MSTPYGPREPGGSDPYQSDPYQSGPYQSDQDQSHQQRPGQRQPGTYAPEEGIPRQEGSHEDDYQRSGHDRGSYRAYPQSGGPVNGGGPAYGGLGTLSYLQGAPVGFGDAIRNAFGHMLTIRGRASRSAFWWFALLAVIAYAVISYISDHSTVAGVILDIVVGIPFIVTSISLAVRRLHDSDKSGWWWWLGFVPFVGGLILLVMYLLPGTRGPNRFNIAR